MSCMVNPRPGGVQSVHRALDVIEVIADHGGHLPIAEIASLTGLPLPTAHRLLQTLVERGYVIQLPSRQYALGARLVGLGGLAGRLELTDATATLAELVAATGESANLAVLSGDAAEYVGQVPSAHSMRMFTAVGRRVELHCTGVGKAMLAAMEPTRAAEIIDRLDLRAHTDFTLASPAALRAELETVRDRGYAVDEQEQELGVRCVAVAAPHPTFGWCAVSVSGPSTRMTDDLVTRAGHLLTDAAASLSPTPATPQGALA